MDLKLIGKIVLVTGSSRGIGLAIAKAFAAEGCRVVLSARSTEQLREAETALRATGAEVAAHAADVGSPDDAARLIEATIAAHDGIDILVNNVGGGARVADSSDDRLARRTGTEPHPDRANDAAGVAAHEGAPGSCGDQRRIDLRLVAAACDVGPIRRGQGGVDLRYRALGAGIRALWYSGEHGVAGLDPGRRERMGPLPPN